jgi:hypothetical protein
VRLFLLLLLSVPALAVRGQKINESFTYLLQKASGEIRVDGQMDEAAWQSAAVATDFHMVLPQDTSRAQVRTEVRMAYDAEHLYLIAVCYQPRPGVYRVESLRRDFAFPNNDNFIFFLDPFDDQLNGFTFGANAAGAQWDGQMFDGGKVNLSWDNKWASAVAAQADAWVFECAIPFKTLRYKPGITRWGINFSRLELGVNEKSAWAPVPRQFPTASLAYTGVLAWDAPPPSPGLNVSLIPYVAGGLAQEEGGQPAERSLRAGGDAKVSITPSLNLDLTVLPDFSQVEVDRQVTNLSRFELFFPERRQFFLENSDLFDNFGTNSIFGENQLRPFFTRRIGLSSPLLAGARLSGKLNRNWRIGAMNMLTGAHGEEGIPHQNYSVLAVQRQLFARSNLSAIAVNRESLLGSSSPDSLSVGRYNRLAGLEYNLASSNNLWTGKLLLHKSFTPGLSGQDFAHAAVLNYQARRFFFGWTHEYVGDNFRAEVGFVPRTGYGRISPIASVNFFPKSKHIVMISPGAGTTVYASPQGRYIESESFVYGDIVFRNQANASLWIARDFVELQDAFDPTNTGGDSLPQGSRHTWNSFGTEINSAPGKLFTWRFNSRYGGYYGGSYLNLSGRIGYRLQPFAALSVDISYSDIQLPAPLSDARLWLLSPRLDLTFTNTLFLTAFFQYNKQQDNMNLNVRLQWRYQPASDLFIVYTGNYLPAGFQPKGQALVFKLAYWLNA